MSKFIEGKENENGIYLKMIRTCKVMDERNIFFFANSSDSSVKPTITLRGEYSNLEVWDPMTGERTSLDVTVKDGNTSFTLKFAAVTSLFVIEVD